MPTYGTEHQRGNRLHMQQNLSGHLGARQNSWKSNCTDGREIVACCPSCVCLLLLLILVRGHADGGLRTVQVSTHFIN